MTTSHRVATAWLAFQNASGGVRRPVTDTDYVRVLELLDHLTNTFDCSMEPYASLFDLLATFAHDWEMANEPELKVPDAAPHEVIAFLMAERGMKQSELAKALGVDQGNLSRVLAGKRSISRSLAIDLAAYFGANVGAFL